MDPPQRVSSDRCDARSTAARPKRPMGFTAPLPADVGALHEHVLVGPHLVSVQAVHDIHANDEQRRNGNDDGPMRALRLPFEWERLDAVDGRTLEWASLAAQRLVHADAVRDAQWAEQRSVPTICRQTGSFSPHLTLSAAGCALSHRKAWEALVADPHAECALIMEDDLCAVAPRFGDKLRLLVATILPAVSSAWQLCFLGFHESTGSLLAEGATPRLSEVPQGMCITGLFGYILHKRGAAALLRQARRLGEADARAVDGGARVAERRQVDGVAALAFGEREDLERAARRQVRRRRLREHARDGVLGH